MSESWITRCPGCATCFRVGEEQLAVARGLVRCGACLHVFTAMEHLLQPDTSDAAEVAGEWAGAADGDRREEAQREEETRDAEEDTWREERETRDAGETVREYEEWLDDPDAEGYDVPELTQSIDEAALDARVRAGQVLTFSRRVGAKGRRAGAKDKWTGATRRRAGAKDGGSAR